MRVLSSSGYDRPDITVMVDRAKFSMLKHQVTYLPLAMHMHTVLCVVNQFKLSELGTTSCLPQTRHTYSPCDVVNQSTLCELRCVPYLPQARHTRTHLGMRSVV